MEFSKGMALKAVLVLGIAGMLFSGYLSYGELFVPGGSGFVCPNAASGIFGIPTCVYGLAMYTLITIIALAGLSSRE